MKIIIFVQIIIMITVLYQHDSVKFIYFSFSK